MKRPRPYIPLAVRVEVAEREVAGMPYGPWWPLYCFAVEGGLPLGRRLTILLGHLPKGAQLDHDPALILRDFNPRTGKYTPDANDPAYLIYRDPVDHQHKTTGRNPGAERTVTTKGSDIGLKTKFARLARRKVDTSDIPEAKKSWFKKAKVKIPSRPFPTQRRKFR